MVMVLKTTDTAMELLKTILDFIAKIAYPLVIGLALCLFRRQLAASLEVLKGILTEIEEGRKNVRVGSIEVTSSMEEAAALKVKQQDLPAAAETIQKLLSPAAPLALGYVDNFLAGCVVKKGGGFEVAVLEHPAGPKFEITRAFTIYIPRKLSDIDSSSQNLVGDEYQGEEIKSISIQSTYGRPFTGFAVLRVDRNTLYPVDVPKTLTSIRHVFRFRQKQLKLQGFPDEAIARLENENLDEFAAIIEEKTESLRASGTVRVIREQNQLFSPGH